MTRKRRSARITSTRSQSFSIEFWETKLGELYRDTTLNDQQLGERINQEICIPLWNNWEAAFAAGTLREDQIMQVVKFIEEVTKLLKFLNGEKDEEIVEGE